MLSGDLGRDPDAGLRAIQVSQIPLLGRLLRIVAQEGPENRIAVQDVKDREMLWFGR